MELQEAFTNIQTDQNDDELSSPDHVYMLSFGASARSFSVSAHCANFASSACLLAAVRLRIVLFGLSVEKLFEQST